MSKKLLHPDDAREWLLRRYRNAYKSWFQGGGEWPLVVSLGVPTEQDFRESTAEVRAWVEAWMRWGGGGQLTWQERQWPRLGTQKLPVSLGFASPCEAAEFIEQGARWRLATRRSDELRSGWPQLTEALLARYFDVVADYSEADFTRLTAALEWLLSHPHSGCYVRQLPIEGLDTKWLEKRTGMMMDLLSTLRGEPAETDFYRACGLRRMPHRVRCRLLCPELQRRLGGLRDLEVPVHQLADLDLRPRAALIIENQETGVAFPDVPGVIGFVQMGNAVSALSSIPWLSGIAGVYWGDIDTHGLAILSRARRAMPRLRSVLMDEETLLVHRALWSQEPAQYQEAEFTALTPEEKKLFAALRGNVWGAKVRLEQERLPWEQSVSVVARALELAL